MTSMQLRINHPLVLKLSQCRKVSIENPLLQGIFNRTGFVFHGLPVHPINGDNYNYSFSRIYLTYLIQRLFNIHRIPGYEEGVSFSDDEQLRNVIENLKESEIENHLSELSRLYEHTQQELTTAVGGESISVYRGFNGTLADMVVLSRARAIERNETTAQVYGNIFNFYAVSHGGHTENDQSVAVSMIQEVPIKDVLVCHQTVNGFSNTDQDIIVINRSPTGIIDIPLSAITGPDPESHGSQEFNHIAERNPSLDHTFIFKHLYRFESHHAPAIHSLPIFGYSPGRFERLGRAIDNTVGKPVYSWRK